MKATEELMAEHRGIERMLAIIETAARRLESGEAVRPGLFREAVDFLSNFADRCHHNKEEENLFPRLEEKGIPREGGPIGVMLHEHGEGRQYISNIGRAAEAYVDGNHLATETLVENVHAYVELLRGHVWKEENILFPAADSALNEDEDRELVERFENVETDIMGPGVHERYHELLDALEEEMGLRTR